MLPSLIGGELMEVHPGVFVSSAATDEWEYDPEVGGEMHLLCHESGVEAGLSRFTHAAEPVQVDRSPTVRRSSCSKARRGSRSPAAPPRAASRGHRVAACGR